MSAFYEPRTSDQISCSVKATLEDTRLTLPQVYGGDQSITNITINLDYANAINQLIPFVSGDQPAIYAMLDRNVFEDDRLAEGIGFSFKSPFLDVAAVGESNKITIEQVRKNRATMISTLLAGALARIAGNGLYRYSALMFLTNMTDG